ncbi:MAG TPA: aldose epimerase family protein [Burkholderiales bacterium]|nr:aldose epimerase family protein [Burkholderiales bacterium]
MEEFVLENGALQARVRARGATLTLLAGAQRLAFDGFIVGRYANRIARGRFVLDATAYQLACNDGRHHLHGGPTGFQHAHWAGKQRGGAVALRYVSPDGHEGYPGALEARVTYSLEQSGLRIDYEASTDRPTIVNLTNHAYFNLAGGGTIDGHELRLDAEHYVPVDEELIPTGALAPVAGTALDFRQWRRIGPARIDHSFVLQGAAELRDPASGRALRIRTTQPGLQVYTGHLSGRLGICLEPQHFPDSPNRPSFPSTVLRPGEAYRHSAVYELCHG